MKRKGMLIVISGPSGSGKGTVVKRLDKDNYALSISMTTRAKRLGEENGKDYFFCSEDEFQEKRNNGEFLEHAIFCGNMYGTPKSYVVKCIDEGKVVILEIDVNGALQVKERFKECVLIFLIPPTQAELERRLVGRNTEDEKTIKHRLRRANDEISVIDQYDYLVINDTVEEAVQQIRTIVDAEYLRPIRNVDNIKYFKGEL